MSDLTNLLRSETKTLDEYLNISIPNVHEIPFSQRNYEWDKTQVDRLWYDLVGIYDNNENEHLLNFFTLSKNDDQEDNYSIYDGQQRTITCLLVLAIISQRLNKVGNESATRAANRIQDDYFRSIDPYNENIESIYKTVFNDNNDSEFFYKITNKNYENNSIDIEIKRLDTNSNEYSLLSNYNLLNKHISNLVEQRGKNNEQKTLNDFCSTMIHKCYLIVLTAYNEEIAARMFESLNNTGKDLEKYYVLKNDMVRYLGEKNVKDSWSEIDNNLKNLSHNNFLKDFSTIKNGKTKKTDILYNIYNAFEIESKGNNLSKQCKELINLLVESSNYYMQILNPNKFNNTNKYEADRFRKLSKYLSDLSFKQHIPIILSMMLKHYDVSEINKVLWAVIVIDIRNFYISEERSNTVEKPFADYAKDLYSGNLSLNELLNNIYQFSKSDSIVKNNIKHNKFSYKSNKYAKTLLIIIYNHLLTNGETEISIDKVDLEHILPKKPKAGSIWLSDFPSEKYREKYTYKLGNLTLWIKGRNRGNKNNEFYVKQKNYEDSPLIENKKISNNKSWTAKEIDERTEYLADTILKIFTI